MVVGPDFLSSEASTSAENTEAYDATAPTISSVTPPANGSYRATQNLDFTVNFSENVTVAGGTPSIGLTIGATARNASYVSGSGTTALLFRYTVVAGDNDSDGIAMASPVALNGATIRDAAGNNAVLTYTVPNTTGVLVDTTAPAVSSINRAGTTPSNAASVSFTVTFNESVGGVNDDTQGYHETITRVFLHGVRLFLREADVKAPLHELVNELLLSPMGRRDWPLRFYLPDSKWVSKAKDILKRTGAEDVASSGEASADWQKSDKPMPRAS